MSLIFKDMFNNKVLSRLRQVVTEFPENNAFLINGEFYTYINFWNCISNIRAGLRDLNSAEKVIGLVVNDDLETYASIFAIWMEGKAYVPLHPKQPLLRNLEIIAQASIEKVLDSNINTPYDKTNVLQTKKCSSLVGVTDDLVFSDDLLAYILFTSGSTGQPKGVQISRGNVAAFIDSFFKAGFEVGETDRCLQCFDLTFDVSVQCFLTPLINGACVYTVPHDQIKYSYIYGLLDDHELTFGVFPPSMIRLLKPYFDEIYLPKLRYCILTAEASPVDLVLEWSKCIPSAEIFNFYGPTEATIYCTYYQVPIDSEIKQANGMLCIGKPFEGIKAVILDGDLNEVARNIKGEMYVAGAQVTQGYWANQEKNEESFITLTSDGKSKRFYKTGDLCSRDEDGDILYYGRLDYQVKIQGYRIELGEIEYHVREAMGGKNSIAFTYDGKGGNVEIAVCAEVQALDLEFIMNSLRTKLPSYMIPSKFLSLEEFPVNTSGKIDRKKIIELLAI
ncbi:MAG: amino acid adenylation domain-containing protein [Flavobacterium sp.]